MVQSVGVAEGVFMVGEVAKSEDIRGTFKSLLQVFT